MRADVCTYSKIHSAQSGAHSRERTPLAVTRFQSLRVCVVRGTYYLMHTQTERSTTHRYRCVNDQRSVVYRIVCDMFGCANGWKTITTHNLASIPFWIGVCVFFLRLCEHLRMCMRSQVVSPQLAASIRADPKVCNVHKYGEWIVLDSREFLKYLWDSCTNSTNSFWQRASFVFIEYTNRWVHTFRSIIESFLNLWSQPFQKKQWSTTNTCNINSRKT